MTVILFVSLSWGVFLSLFVLKPLFTAHAKLLFSPTYKYHEEYQKDLVLINLLFAKIIHGTCTDEKIDCMPKQEALNYLYDICEKLEDLGVSWKQNLQLQNEKKESGNSSLQFILALFMVLGILFFTTHYSGKIFAQETKAQQASEPRSVTIPPPFILPDTGYWLPAVNQFILIPENASLHVYYVGMFSNSFHAKSTKILLPFPKNITGISIHAKDEATLDKIQNSSKDALILNTPLEASINQIQAEFILHADNGSLEWKKNTLDILPGVTIFIMPESDGILRNILSHFYLPVNIEPARIINFPKDFKSALSEDVLKPDANSNNTSHELSRQYVRVGDFSSLFPEFNIVGIAPSRFFIYLLILFFCCFFAAALSISFFKLRS